MKRSNNDDDYKIGGSDQTETRTAPHPSTRALSSTWQVTRNATQRGSESGVHTASATSSVQHQTATPSISSAEPDLRIDDGHAREGVYADSEEESSDVQRISPTMKILLPDRLLRRFARIIVSRNEYMMSQAHRVNEMQKYLDKRRFTEESLEKLMKPLLPGAEKRPGLPPSSSLETQQSQLLQDWNSLQHQSAATAISESDSSSKQYQISKAEKKFIRALKTFLMTLPQGAIIAATFSQIEEALKVNEEKKCEESEEIPQVAQDYFGRCGDIQLLLEQIGDREERYHEEKGIREHLRDQDKELETQDAEFDALFETEQNELQAQLKTAYADTDNLRGQCDEQGIDVEALRFQEHDHESSNSSSTSSLGVLEEEPSQLHPFSSAISPGLGSNVQEIYAVPPQVDSAFEGVHSTRYSSPLQDERGVERWLEEVNGKPNCFWTGEVLQDEEQRQKPHLVNRQRRLRTQNVGGRRRFSDSAILGDFFHEADRD